MDTRKYILEASNLKLPYKAYSYIMKAFEFISGLTFYSDLNESLESIALDLPTPSVYDHIMKGLKSGKRLNSNVEAAIKSYNPEIYKAIKAKKYDVDYDNWEVSLFDGNSIDTMRDFVYGYYGSSGASALNRDTLMKHPKTSGLIKSAQRALKDHIYYLFKGREYVLEGKEKIINALSRMQIRVYDRDSSKKSLGDMTVARGIPPIMNIKMYNYIDQYEREWDEDDFDDHYDFDHKDALELIPFFKENMSRKIRKVVQPPPLPAGTVQHELGHWVQGAIAILTDSEKSKQFRSRQQDVDKDWGSYASAEIEQQPWISSELEEFIEWMGGDRNISNDNIREFIDTSEFFTNLKSRSRNKYKEAVERFFKAVMAWKRSGKLWLK